MAILLESTVNCLNFGRGGGSIASNTRFGSFALCSNTTGARNTAIGYHALCVHIATDGNTAAGFNAGKNASSGGCMTAIGYRAGECTCGRSVAVGAFAGTYTNAERYVAVGYKASCCSANGEGTTTVGREAGMRAGTETVSIGDFAGRTNTGNNSVFIGRQSSQGVYRNNNNTVSVGHLANYYDYGGGGQSDSGFIGFNAYQHSGCATQGIWGNYFNSVCNCVYVAWTNVSDCRDKTNIQPLTNLGLNFVRKLRPVKYVLDQRESYVNQCMYEYGIKDGTLKQEKTRFGFIAQEIEFASRAEGENFDGVTYDSPRDKYSVSYLEMIGSLTRSLQEINLDLDEIENILIP
jgi:hypothetical protein